METEINIRRYRKEFSPFAWKWNTADTDTAESRGVATDHTTSVVVRKGGCVPAEGRAVPRNGLRRSARKGSPCTDGRKMGMANVYSPAGSGYFLAGTTVNSTESVSREVPREQSQADEGRSVASTGPPPVAAPQQHLPSETRSGGQPQQHAGFFAAASDAMVRRRDGERSEKEREGDRSRGNRRGNGEASSWFSRMEFHALTLYPNPLKSSRQFG